ncbi:MAG: class I SAM-dependent methyltransferase [Planctomycetes bacterium]|nr:class I SAM-dependent methyltransferase [Planctomycetota bacterium]
MVLTFDHERRFGARDYDERYYAGQVARYEAGVYATRERWLHRYVHDVEPGDVLDAACGIGWFTRRLLQAGHRVCGVDFASAALVQARGLAPAAPLVRGALERLPLRPRTFDLILACDVLEHVYEPEALLRELHRVARPGARLVLLTDNAASPSRWKGFKRLAERIRRRAELATALERIRRSNGAPSLHVALYSAREVERMLERTGWRVRAVDTFPRLAPASWERLLASRVAHFVLRRHRGGALIVKAARD